jgi:hypothetical protein
MGEGERSLAAGWVGREADADVLFWCERIFYGAIELAARLEAAEGVYADDPAVGIGAIFYWAISSAEEYTTMIWHFYPFIEYLMLRGFWRAYAIFSFPEHLEIGGNFQDETILAFGYGVSFRTNGPKIAI